MHNKLKEANVACQQLLNLLNFHKTTSLKTNNEMNRVLFMLIQISDSPEKKSQKGKNKRVNLNN